MKHKTKRCQSTKSKDNEPSLKKERGAIELEDMTSLSLKMDNVKGNPEEGLEAAIEVLRRLGHKRGYRS